MNQQHFRGNEGSGIGFILCGFFYTKVSIHSKYRINWNHNSTSQTCLAFRAADNGLLLNNCVAVSRYT